MVLKLAGGAHRDQHEPAQLCVAAPAAAFGDVGRDRGARTAELGRQPVRFYPRELTGGLVDVQDEPVAPLPYRQIPIIPHVSQPHPRLSAWPLLLISRQAEMLTSRPAGRRADK